jgi:hypothetical protein
MDPTAEPTDGDSTGVEPSEPEFVTPGVTAPESADPQATAKQVTAPETGDPQAATTQVTAPETAAPETELPSATETGDPEDDWPEDDWPEDDGLDDDWLVELPSQNSLFDRHRTLFVLGSLGVAVLIAATAAVVAAVTTAANSTLNVRVIVPAPASADGLHRDYTDEANPQFQAGLAQFQQRYTASFTKQVSSHTTAIYTNATAGQPPSVGLLYLGFNSAGETINPASAISASVSHIKTSMPGPTSTVHVSGLSGDTSAACVGSSVGGSPIAICVWATDKTEAIIATLTPGTYTQLASVLRKMEPDLVRS